ncbi:glycoside hydrolase family 5 protein [Phanerochaete carnosa HHB-10118-sp]|uniref:Glycoside hydrolase family 5 protein n=1 Tax=Phanerochaete carnosa (strain HHB-10118-sp) TaxID=650164 RepID=K5VJ38_PHACS|nr:glycoside hydrolase family 5 protein [Phanerochaete carnosa HHB-10118-sp]EKM51308.1 glycoside hydrolase family 5 protein [Phanerochaete carnosa HHB-10118-sp]
MENFISGFPGCEFQIREALAETIGTAKASFFFDKFLEYFFTDADAAFFKSIGLNCIRIALNYRAFEDDMNPLVLKDSCFTQLDRIVRVCAAHGIYTILDMHTAPGGQNGGWHSDAGTHLALFWMHKNLQDRLVWLWTELARHYRDEPWVAGYNPLNEPADPTPDAARLIGYYDRVIAAIRSVDPHHTLFLDGNTYATDFSGFPDDAGRRWSNIAFAIHDYSLYGFPKTPEPYARTPEQTRRMRRSYEKKREWMDERGLCVWNGEWGPVYARKEYEGDDWESINERRYNVLKDQLELYDKDRLSWSIWLYKDIGFQGMVHVSADTPYMRLLNSTGFLQKKYRLAVDPWGANDAAVKHLYAPLVQLVTEAVPEEAHRRLYPYPVWTLEGRVERIARCMLLGEFLVKEWAEHFVGKTEEELDELAKSFLFENCLKREGLNKVLTEHAKSVGLV